MTEQFAPERAFDVPIVGVGLKMFLGYDQTLAYLRALAACADRFLGVALFVLPSFPAIAAARDILGPSGLTFGAQDGHWEAAGAYTGCVSAPMLRELGCTYMEVGHAERRNLFGEDDAVVAAKAEAAMRSQLVPVVCVGETDPDDNAELTVFRQVRTVVRGLTNSHGSIVIAYEPVWAIGADAPADIQRIACVVDSIRTASADHEGDVRVIYGGSVTAASVGEVVEAGADGVFVGRAALDIDELLELTEQVRRAA